MSSTTESLAGPPPEQEAPHLGSSLALLPRVNLLPPEIAERRVFRQVQAGLGAAVVGTVVVMGMLVVSANHGVTAAKEQLQVAQTEHTTLQSQTAQYSNVNSIYQAATDAQTQLSTAMGDEVRFSQLLNDLSLSIPSTVWVTSLSMSASGGTPTTAGGATAATPVGTFTVSAVGFAHDDVALWLESIAGLTTYSDPYFSGSSESLMGTRKVVTFGATASINSNALSGRYTRPIGG